MRKVFHRVDTNLKNIPLLRIQAITGSSAGAAALTVIADGMPIAHIIMISPTFFRSDNIISVFL
jgi:hypothetical protein